MQYIETETGQPDVIIYTTPTCSWCRLAKKYLTEKKVAFREVDVSRDEAGAQEMVRLSGQRGVPVLRVRGKTVVGFDRKKLERLLAPGLLN